jgi:hypothetical protein
VEFKNPEPRAFKGSCPVLSRSIFSSPLRTARRERRIFIWSVTKGFVIKFATMRQRFGEEIEIPSARLGLFKTFSGSRPVNGIL